MDGPAYQEIIWSTRYEEVQSVESQSQGGKGGGPKTTVTSYSYFANFAIGLCAGPIGGIGRIWADGKILDRVNYTIRLHKGTEDQAPDSLIQAKQGATNTPAYKGIAYLVFENFPLEEFGNRIPQIAVEVIRPVGELERRAYGVNMIPGATEFGYDTQPIIEARNAVESVKLNVNQSLAETDFIASLDELIGICPNLRQIALVVTWFGDDLRAGQCQIKPAVEVSHREITSGSDWMVAGVARQSARLVSRIDGLPALGGTPTDASVIRAIQAIKGRGLEVCLNPFLMMDIPAENELPDPYGEARQARYPWRGRITCDPAPGRSSTPDQTDNVRAQISSFFGDVQLSQFAVMGSGVSHLNQSQWSYRRMILHYAHLAQVAGGVDMFLIGSEMRGLTSLRAANHAFPFVEALVELAEDAATVLGPSCTVTYGADWTEYFGYHPRDDSQNVYFNLDPLWSSPAIGAVGIDNYMPLSDWRGEGDPGGLGRSSADRDMLTRQVTGGEGYDWYYSSDADRVSGNRSTIEDGLGKPWVFRYKDLHSWWSNQHFERHNGTELAQPTPWVPQSKPIIFTEFGAPAAHNGAAQPNVFFDPKSAESKFPYFSNGSRDDVVQANYIAAHQRHWDETHAEFVDANNPASISYAGRMVDFQRSQLWAWDARPFPTFPDATELWSDSANWHKGHWLNGRFGNVRLADLISEIMRDNSVGLFDVTQVYGAVDGYIVADNTSARGALEVLIALFGIAVYEDGGILYFKSRGLDKVTYLDADDIVQERDEPGLASRKEPETELPISVHLRHIDPDKEFQETETQAERINRERKSQQTFSAPFVLSQNRVQPILEKWLQDRWTARESLSLSVSSLLSSLTIGDEFVLSENPLAQRWRIQKVEQGVRYRISAEAVETGEIYDFDGTGSRASLRRDVSFGKPLVHFLDLPTLPGRQEQEGNHIAATAVPRRGPLAIYASPSDDGFTYQQTIENSAFTGKLTDNLPSTQVTSRLDSSTELLLELHNGQLSSAPMLNVLNGANSVAVRSQNGSWEVLQYLEAELIGTREWRLSKLLRGQLGTEPEAQQGALADADIVILNQAIVPLENGASDRGLEMNWLIGPVGKALDDPEFSATSFSPGYRSLLPYRPVHLRGARKSSGDVVLSWTRRDRVSADDWVPVDIPLSESVEQYKVVLSAPSQGLFETFVSEPSATITSDQLEETSGALPAVLDIAVSQVSVIVGVGPSSNITI